MATRVPDQHDLLARLEKLERDNRRVRQAGMLVLVLCFSVFLMGQAKTGQVKPKPRTGAHVLEADKFVLKDIEGKKRAELMMEPGGPGLVLYDHEGNRIGRFGGTGEGNGAGLSLQQPSGGSKITLISLQDGPHLLLFDTNGKFRGEVGASVKGPYLFFNDGKEKPRIALIVESDAPKLQISDQEGFTAVLGSNSLVTTKSKEVQRTTAASLLMFGKEREVIWRAP